MYTGNYQQWKLDFLKDKTLKINKRPIIFCTYYYTFLNFYLLVVQNQNQIIYRITAKKNLCIIIYINVCISTIKHNILRIYEV